MVDGLNAWSWDQTAVGPAVGSPGSGSGRSCCCCDSDGSGVVVLLHIVNQKQKESFKNQ